MTNCNVGLQVRVTAGVRSDAIFDDGAAGIAMQLGKIPAFFNPLASGCRPRDCQARIDRCAFVKCLRYAKQSVLTKPRQPVITENFRGMRPIRRQWTIVDLPIRQIRHRGKIEGPVVIGAVAAAIPIRGIGVHEAGVVTSQFAEGVADGAKQPRPRPPRQTELNSIVPAARRDYARALGAEGDSVEIVDTGIVRYDRGPVQKVRKLRTRVADV